MASNFAGPYSIEITYIVDLIEHKHSVNCDVQGTPSAGDAPATITLETKDAVGIGMQTAVNDYVTDIAGFYNTSVDFIGYTLWKHTPLTDIKTFISADSLAISGTSGSATRVAGQLTMSYRTQEGGIMKLVFLETIFTDDNQISLSGWTNSNAVSIGATLLGVGGWVLARDTSYPIASLRASFGENERVFKKRYRN